ncbi:MAG: class I SAM-dependent methyltransferase [Candidatus Hydrogenedentales bacterium]|jgi:predicted O-methyltransferase YrrM
MTDKLRMEICRAVEVLNGWCTPGKAVMLAEEIEQMDARLCVEIGVFAGRSLIPMAMMLRELGHGGKVVGIDPWTSEASREGYAGANAQWWGEVVDHEAVYQMFLASVDKEGVIGQVEIIRAKSDDVCPPDNIDLLHIDGQHTPQAIRDVARYAPRVRRGGIVCLDDMNWSNDGDMPVKTAAERLLDFGFVEKYPVGTGAVFVRMRLITPANAEGESELPNTAATVQSSGN